MNCICVTSFVCVSMCLYCYHCIRSVSLCVYNVFRFVCMRVTGFVSCHCIRGCVSAYVSLYLYVCHCVCTYAAVHVCMSRCMNACHCACPCATYCLRMSATMLVRVSLRLYVCVCVCVSYVGTLLFRKSQGERLCVRECGRKNRDCRASSLPHRVPEIRLCVELCT